MHLQEGCFRMANYGRAKEGGGKDAEMLLCRYSTNTPPANQLFFLLSSIHMVLIPVLLKKAQTPNPNICFKVPSSMKVAHVVLHTARPNKDKDFHTYLATYK